jgi:hypothetical protein
MKFDDREFFEYFKKTPRRIDMTVEKVGKVATKWFR